MLYFKAIRDAHDYFTGWSLIENELLTERERNTKFRYLHDSCFTIVNVSPKQTYKSFGCRFECR